MAFFRELGVIYRVFREQGRGNHVMVIQGEDGRRVVTDFDQVARELVSNSFSEEETRVKAEEALDWIGRLVVHRGESYPDKSFDVGMRFLEQVYGVTYSGFKHNYSQDFFTVLRQEAGIVVFANPRGPRFTLARAERVFVEALGQSVLGLLEGEQA